MDTKNRTETKNLSIVHVFLVGGAGAAVELFCFLQPGRALKDQN